jgi:hypothetical protein
MSVDLDALTIQAFDGGKASIAEKEGNDSEPPHPRCNLKVIE